MRRYLLSLILLVICISLSQAAYAAEDKDQSMGTAAGVAARQLTDQTQETVKVASAETEKASKQVAQVTDDAFKKFSAQAQTAMKSVQETSQEFLKRLQEEWQKFQKAYNKPAKP